MDGLDVVAARMYAQRYARMTVYTPMVGGQMQLQAAANDVIPYAEMWAEVHWTDEAAERIRRDEYRYISPEFVLDSTDPGSGDRVGAELMAIALCTRPFLKGMAKVADPDDNNVSRVQVFQTGEWEHEFYGRITIEPRHLTEMIDNHRTLSAGVRDEANHGPTELVVDYNHQSLWGGPDEAKAAGWVRGAGLYIDNAADEAATRAAATQPGGSIPATENREVIAMTEQTQDVGAEVEAERAPDPDRITDIEAKLAEQQRVLDGLLAAAAADDPAPEADDAAPDSDDGQDSTDAEADDVQALEAVTAAEADNKLAPALKAWAVKYARRDPEGFKEFVAAAPPVVPLGRAGETDAQTGPTADADGVREFIAAKTADGMSLADAQKAAIREMGREAFDAYRGGTR